MTLEELIRKYPDENGLIGSKYIIEVIKEKNEILRINIRPLNKNDDELNFCIARNKLIPILK